MRIFTLTLSPAFDLHCSAESLSVGHENLVHLIRREAGGKGVNISRGLKSGGTDSLAVVLLGEENADSFEAALYRDGLSYRGLRTHGRIRENITVHLPDGEETRISFEGFQAAPSILEDVLSILSAEGLRSSVVTFTGRAPEGIDMSLIKNFLRTLREMGARVVIDSRSFSLSDLADCSPYLIKPNAEEISVYAGREISGLDMAAKVAVDVRRLGIENVMITLGGDGAVLATADGVFGAIPPKVSALSTIGAGDSSIAGFLSAIAQGLSESEALKTAVAYGTAACLTEGTLPPTSEDIEKIFSEIRTVRL